MLGRRVCRRLARNDVIAITKFTICIYAEATVAGRPLHEWRNALGLLRRALTTVRSTPQNSTHRTAHDGPADRATGLAADRLSHIGRDLAGDAVGHGAGKFARDELPGGETLSARTAGAENAGERGADRAQDCAEAAGGRRLLTRRARGRRAGGRRRGRAGLLQAFLQHLIG